MLDIKFIRENTADVRKAIEVKNINFDLDLLLDLDKSLSVFKTDAQKLQEQRNANAKKIPKASNDERPELIALGKSIAKQLDEITPKLNEAEVKFTNMMLQVPNLPSKNAPIGKDESDNVVVKTVGEVPSFSFKALDHVEILEKHNWAEFQKIASISGSRSYSLRDDMVILEMSMHRLALDILKKKGFTIISTPSLAREEALVGTGHFPGGKDQVYYLPEDDMYLSGTAEVQLNSLHAGDMLKESDLPILYCGYSPCFRREAGSYGRDVRGLIRVHQFMKVEQYVICKNSVEESEKWHKALLETSEEIVQALELPYRIIECCTGDMGAGKVKMFDIEAWVPSEEKYRETHSCSALHEWQSRRTKTRYRDNEGKATYVHTLNNTAIATPRILVPFLENHQQEDGSIYLPVALRPYFFGQESLGKQ